MLGIAGIALVMALGAVNGCGNSAVGVDTSVMSVAIDDSCTHYIYADLPTGDLGNGALVTKDDMKLLVDRYCALYPDSALKGCEGAFIEASNLTGLDPIFLFSLAGIESGWGTSKAHIEQGNPYSMGMYGDGKHIGYRVADSFYDGIIEGANYIYEHYYLTGQTTLYSMNHQGDHSYCAGDSSWEAQIDSEMRYCRKLLMK